MKSSLILLHGALGSRAQLQPLKQLLSNDFEIYLMDLEGHGINPLPKHEFSVENFAQNLSGFINKHDLAPANIFGYSMGGFVAMYLAMQQPTSVNRIFTLATKLDWNPASAVREATMLDPASIENKFPDYAMSLRQRHSGDWKELLNRTAEMMIRLGERHPLKQEAFLNLQHRVRFSVGDKDKMVSLEETIEWYRKLKHSELQIFPNTQHPIERVNLEMLSNAIKEFFLYER